MIYFKSTLYFKVQVQKKLLHPFDHILQCRDMISKSFLPAFGDRIGGIGLSTDKALVHFDIAIFLQAHQVCSQVTIGDFQHLLQVVETDLIVDHQNAHNAQPDAVVKNFI